VRPAVVTAPVGAAAAVAVTITPVGAVTAVAGAAPPDSAVDTAASTARVFLLRLPGGRPRLWGAGGVAAASFVLFLLPNGQPRLRPPSPLGPPAPAPRRTPVDDMAEKETGWRGEGSARRRR
jgi:hypothetical protein